jgi:hypothetical protein
MNKTFKCFEFYVALTIGIGADADGFFEAK